MNMGRLDSYPTDANSVVLARFAAKDTPLTVLGHEAGHLFLAFASIPDPTNPAARPMLGFQGVHWSFVFNSEASLDEGEQLTDLGDGRFVTAAVTQGYAPLDRYLMGFTAPADVPDTFVVLNPSVSPLRMSASTTSFKRWAVALRTTRWRSIASVSDLFWWCRGVRRTARLPVACSR
jgi:hypothetical protein